eukprot:3395602-Rhodomonas_salina.1
MRLPVQDFGVYQSSGCAVLALRIRCHAYVRAYALRYAVLASRIAASRPLSALCSHRVCSAKHGTDVAYMAAARH